MPKVNDRTTPMKLEIIGELLNVKVLIDRESRTVILGTEPPIKFSIDHPYIQGTKLEREARAALGND
jgi:hypothetical protein